MNKLDQMQELIDKLNYYIKMYDEGTPVISDKEYDDLYFQLEELENQSGICMANSPTCHVDYFSLNKLKKVKHSHPMLSLNKTKSIQDILDFKNDKDVIAMLKMDGLTCSLRYEQGVLVSAETRGNGEIGEDITHNIVTVKCVPIEIPFKDTLVVDGEVICTYKDFKPFSDKFANPRNFAAGSIRLLNNGECANRHLTFIVWDVIQGFEDCKTLTEKLYKIDSLGFTFVPHLHWFPDMEVSESKFDHISRLITDWATEEDFQYPYDGLVFKYNDCNYYSSLGETGHHPKGGLAFKFYDEEYETRLFNIEYTMGKTGILTPVAEFEPVHTDDSTIEKASLHNLNIMKSLLGKNPYQGQHIIVVKMNQIIPQIVRADTTFPLVPVEFFELPQVCPICGEPTIIKDDFLYCSNPNCEGKLINKLDHFVGKKGLDIKGLSKATLQKLINWEWVNSISDIFGLYQYRDEWYKKDGFGVKSVDNILEAIENSKECELWQFISALSIPLIGSTYAKDIARHCAGWFQFMECIGPHMLNKNGYNFTQWDGFGPNMDASLHNFNYDEADQIVNKYLHLKNTLFIEQKENNSNINGINFVITGKLKKYKNRDELVNIIENNGGKVLSSVTKNTNYLINNDINSTSSKNIKAKSLGIPIITEEQFDALL